MTHKIDTTIFSEPSGNVKGIVIGLLNNNRVAHAYLYTDAPPQISLDKVRGNPTLDEVNELTVVLSAFLDEVRRNK